MLCKLYSITLLDTFFQFHDYLLEKSTLNRAYGWQLGIAIAVEQDQQTTYVIGRTCQNMV